MHLPPACNRRQLTDHHILPPLEIRHPHYPYPDSLLLAFSLVDIAPNRKLADSDYQFGVHHGIVLTACQIIAGNAKRAYLSYDQLGENPVQLPYNGILTQKTYYLQVPQGKSILSTLVLWPCLHKRLQALVGVFHTLSFRTSTTGRSHKTVSRDRGNLPAVHRPPQKPTVS
jgi:hypothetical protein